MFLGVVIFLVSFGNGKTRFGIYFGCLCCQREREKERTQFESICRRAAFAFAVNSVYFDEVEII